MSTPVLATKLYIPPPRAKIVRRSHLVERLNEGLTAGHKLTLISAPAAFGKTTLISEWIAGCKRPVAWLSLDEGDDDLQRFLTYLIAALQTLALSKVEGIVANIGAGALAALQSPQPPATESILTVLLNEIAAIPDRFMIVLDDYHLLDAKPVDKALNFLLEHQPPQMHLVIVTREDPSLSLARLRTRGLLTELRAADLRFTSSEAAEFLNKVMSLNLSVEDITALEARTEGWIAGLQLAALSMQGREDIASFIQAFTGSHRFVLDYLVEEVLQRQPERVRSFLLLTAILDRLCAPLCNAVTEREDGKEMLEALERGNLFVIPLDDQRQWYRYHHLFAGVLQAYLIEAQPDRIAALHKRASAWYERNGLRSDAIRHALAGEDYEHAAGLLELAWPTMDINYQSAAWLGWVKALPNHVMRARPVLSVGYAWALLDAGELESSEAHLQNAERWLEYPANEMGGGKMIVMDKELFKSLPASIATARAYRYLAIGDVPNAVRYARQALELAPEGDQIRHMQGTALLGLAQYASGNLEAANRSYTEFQIDLLQSGDIATATGIAFVLANIKLTQGRLRQAIQTYQQALKFATSQDETLPVGTADLYRGLAELCCEHGDLKAATDYLLTAKKLGEQAAPTDWQHRLYVAEARLQEAQGNLGEALHLLEEAERRYIRSPLPDVLPIPALIARGWIRQGKLAEALEWARDQGLHVDDAISFLHEFEYITLARLLIARYQRDRTDATFFEAINLLERLSKAAEEGGRMGSLIEILILQSLAHQAQDNLPHALTALVRALALAEPEGYMRIFLDEGEEMRSLIEKQSLNRGHPLSDYADKLLAAFSQPVAALKSTFMHQKSDMVEPLSERELEVLKLLRSELSGPEIAGQLIISLNTLRTHTKNIYNKLGVNNRQAAIRRADELDLF